MLEPAADRPTELCQFRLRSRKRGDLELDAARIVDSTEEGLLAYFGVMRKCAVPEPKDGGLVDDPHDPTGRGDPQPRGTERQGERRAFHDLGLGWVQGRASMSMASPVAHRGTRSDKRVGPRSHLARRTIMSIAVREQATGATYLAVRDRRSHLGIDKCLKFVHGWLS